MKCLRRLPNENWREVIERYATNPDINLIGIDPEMLVEEYDYRTSELHEEPHDAAWYICEGSGLLDEIEGVWTDDEDELAA